jgi:TetR/AcrR family transcriptional regulator, transcriptional repressor for nem operon
MDTADRLIESTRELLWERGYVGTSPKAIQQRAGAGQGSMYHHFDGKPALALAAIERTAEEMSALAETQFSGSGSARDRLIAYLLRERDVLRGCPIGGLTQDPDIMSDAHLKAPVTETLAWLRGRIAELVVEGAVDGSLPASLDPANTAASIVAAMQGGYVLARAADDPALFENAIAGILPLLGER